MSTPKRPKAPPRCTCGAPLHDAAYQISTLLEMAREVAGARAAVSRDLAGERFALRRIEQLQDAQRSAYNELILACCALQLGGRCPSCAEAEVHRLFRDEKAERIPGAAIDHLADYRAQPPTPHHTDCTACGEVITTKRFATAAEVLEHLQKCKAAQPATEVTSAAKACALPEAAATPATEASP